jgi:hypothetical protein
MEQIIRTAANTIALTLVFNRLMRVIVVASCRITRHCVECTREARREVLIQRGLEVVDGIAAWVAEHAVEGATRETNE